MTSDLENSANVTALSPNAAPTYRNQPQNIEAEQALLGAILVNNDALNKVNDFLEENFFYEPVHQRIYGVIETLVDRGQIANPVTLKQYFETDDALSEVGGSQYLARLAGSAVTIINAEHYGRMIYDLYLRRSLISIGEDIVNEAFDADVEANGESQIEQAEQSLYSLAEMGTTGSGFQSFADAATEAVRMAEAAHKRDTKLVGVDTGLKDLNEMLGGMHPSDLLILAARPAMGKSSLATNISVNAAKDGAIVAFFSLEMSAEQLATRILAEEAQISSEKIRRGAIDADRCGLSTAVAW
jgi:replicative DNA helicase